VSELRYGWQASERTPPTDKGWRTDGEIRRSAEGAQVDESHFCACFAERPNSSFHDSRRGQMPSCSPTTKVRGSLRAFDHA
jgi:hypothetical protein